jgi:cell division protein FtsB
VREMALRLRPRFPRSKFGVAPQVAGVLLIVGLAGAMAIEPTRQLIEQRDRISGMAQDLHSLERSNRRLDDRIHRLQDPDFVEQQAREVGMVRPGETSMVVMPPSTKAVEERERRRALRQPPPAAPEPSWTESLLNFLGF